MNGSISIIVSAMFFSCRYALLRRRLLINPHILKDEDSSPNFFIDNPLSQNPSKLLFPLLIAYTLSLYWSDMLVLIIVQICSPITKK